MMGWVDQAYFILTQEFYIQTIGSIGRYTINTTYINRTDSTSFGSIIKWCIPIYIIPNHFTIDCP